MSCNPPCASSGEDGSAEESLTDDWLACFDLSDLPSEPFAQGDQPELPELDLGSFDISCLLTAEENSPSFALSEEDSLFLDLSEGFSSIFKADNADGEPDRCRQTDVSSSPIKDDGSMVSSPNNSDAGSSVAVADGVNLYTGGLDNHVKGDHSAASCGKRQHDEVASDMEGGNGEPVDKKQQRLQRNRELAFESRQRKKCYVSDLEAKCKMLEQERNQMQQQICFSAAENAVLKEEIARLKKMKGGEGVAEPAVLFKDSLPLEFLSLLICLHLLARLSLCVSPFLALVLRAVIRPQSPGEGEGPIKEGGDSERRFHFHFMVNDMRLSLEDHCFHRPFRNCRLPDGQQALPACAVECPCL